MTVYAAKGHSTGVAVVVFPCGSYQFLAMDLQGTDVCDWLTARGFICVLLKYRVPDSVPTMKNGHSCSLHVPPQTSALTERRRANREFF